MRTSADIERRRISKTSAKASAMSLALALVAFLALAADIPAANAVVCAAGVHRAGCVGPNGAVVTHRHCFWRAGVRICR